MGHPAFPFTERLESSPALLGVADAPLPRPELAAGRRRFVGANTAKSKHFEHIATRMPKSSRGWGCQPAVKIRARPRTSFARRASAAVT
jgi:hypothetical protein